MAGFFRTAAVAVSRRVFLQNSIPCLPASRNFYSSRNFAGEKEEIDETATLEFPGLRRPWRRLLAQYRFSIPLLLFTTTLPMERETKDSADERPTRVLRDESVIKRRRIDVSKSIFSDLFRINQRNDGDRGKSKDDG